MANCFLTSRYLSTRVWVWTAKESHILQDGTNALVTIIQREKRKARKWHRTEWIELQWQCKEKLTASGRVPWVRTGSHWWWDKLPVHGERGMHLNYKANQMEHTLRQTELWTNICKQEEEVAIAAWEKHKQEWINTNWTQQRKWRGVPPTEKTEMRDEMRSNTPVLLLLSDKIFQTVSVLAT